MLDLLVVLNGAAVDGFDVDQPRPLAACARADLAANLDSLAELVLFDQRTGNERIRFAGAVVVRAIADEAVPLGMQFQHAFDRAAGDGRLGGLGSVLHELGAADPAPILRAGARASLLLLLIRWPTGSAFLEPLRRSLLTHFTSTAAAIAFGFPAAAPFAPGTGRGFVGRAAVGGAGLGGTGLRTVIEPRSEFVILRHGFGFAFKIKRREVVVTMPVVRHSELPLCEGRTIRGPSAVRRYVARGIAATRTKRGCTGAQHDRAACPTLVLVQIL